MKKTVKDLMEEFGISEVQLRKMLLGKKFKPQVIKRKMSGNVFSFGVVSDTHLCSIHEKLNELHTFYQICRKEGIKEILHAGDLVAGWGIYKGQENEVHTFGAKKQAEAVIKNYPKVKGIKTYFCLGNHDLCWWDKSGIDIGEIISDKREDMVYLGQYSGEVILNGVKIRLLHGIGGRGGVYAISYKGQKIAEQIPSGQKPHILILGHWHTCLYFFYRNIHIINAGAFEGQSTLMLRMGINPTIGGWIVKVRVGDDKKRTILSISPTFIPFL